MLEAGREGLNRLNDNERRGNWEHVNNNTLVGRAEAITKIRGHTIHLETNYLNKIQITTIPPAFLLPISILIFTHFFVF